MGLIGGLGSVFILEGFEELYESPITQGLILFYALSLLQWLGMWVFNHRQLLFKDLPMMWSKEVLLNRLLKEVGLGLINGGALALLVILFGVATQQPTDVSLTIALSMLCVIIVSALIGTFVPIVLNRRGIDPAIATGPFITTSNDIFGIFLFFYIAKWLLV